MLRRIDHPLIYLTVVLAVCFLWVNDASLTPDKNITVVTKEQQIPQWKQLWDEARFFAQNQDIEGAVTKYLEVLKIKPHIEEVKWELSKNYLLLKQFDKALVILESLLEASPEKIEYLVSAGEAAMQQQKASLANRYFGQALALDPSGPMSELALLGMVEALTAQGKKGLSVPLMEQLFQREIISYELLLALAHYHSEQHNFEKGAFYYRELLGKYRVEDKNISDAAYTFEKSGFLDEAAEQWLHYLQEYPDHREFRTKLVDYYQREGKLQAALPHMLYLLEHNIEREHYLLPVARIYLYEIGRADRALSYFEQYQKEFPDGIDVSDEITGLQMIVANDLLAIVENNGVWMLWKDLAEVTPERVGIYRAMADILREMGQEKENELIEILKIINAHEPEDTDVISQIIHLFRNTGRLGDCSEFLDEAAAASENKTAFYLFRAQCQSWAGNDIGRLKSYVSYLKLKPDDASIRIQALRLAGALGFLEQLDQMYQRPDGPAGRQMSDIDYAYATELIRNGLSRSAESLLGAFDRKHVGPKKQMLLIRELSALDLQQNRLYKAEQNRRTFATNNPDGADGYLLLSDLFIHKNDISTARFWLDAMHQRGMKLSHAQKSVLFYQELLIDRALKKVDVYQRAVHYLNMQLKANRIIAEDVDILLFAAEHYLQTHRFDNCIQLINRFRPKFKGDDSVSATLIIARKERSAKTRSWVEMPLKEVSFTQRIAVGEKLMKMGRLEDAAAVLTDVAAELPGSVRIKVLLAQTHMTLLTYAAAEKIYSELNQLFDQETYFIEQLFRLESLMGTDESILQEFSVALDENGRKDAIQPKHEFLDYPEIKLMWARSLWTVDKWEESLDAYGLLDTEMKRDLDRMKQDLQKIPAERLESERIDANKQSTFEDPEVLDLIMSNEFVAENLAGDISRTSSRYYDSYRWGIIINKEMTAKSSLKAKEFYQAEIDYKELFREEADVTEYSYPDLAMVYGRLGRYQEETELLEKIKETQINYPALSQITEKNIRRRQPFLFIEGTYLEEEGRDGFIDITKKNGGLGLQVKPTLYQDAGFIAGRNEYGDSSASTIAKSSTLVGNYKIQFSDSIEAGAKFGVEDFDDEGETLISYDLLMKGTLEQRVELYGGIKQEPVDDNIDVLLSDIHRRAIQLGFSLDYFFGMFFGFDIDLNDYNDNNEGEQYYLWSSYRWFGDRSSIDITYSYLNVQNQMANETTAEDMNEYAPSYWSPSDYWKHRLSCMYKMELWPTGRLQSGTGSFSAKYGVGYEEGDSLTQEVDMNILLEITTSFLVKGTFSTVFSEDYDLLNGSVSFIYRW